MKVVIAKTGKQLIWAKEIDIMFLLNDKNKHIQKLKLQSELINDKISIKSRTELTPLKVTHGT